MNNSTIAQPELVGSPSQVEWALGIRLLVNADFDRVANTLQSVMRRQSEVDQVDTRAILHILEERRDETLANNQAGYFIRHWQEVTDQVRQLIRKDPRYEAMQMAKAVNSKGF